MFHEHIVNATSQRALFPHCDSSICWSNDEDDDDRSDATLPLTPENEASDLSQECMSVWVQSTGVLVFSRRIAIADQFTERLFLDTLARRTAPLQYVRIEQSVPLRWHILEELISALASVGVDELVFSNLHFSKELLIPWMIHPHRLELRDCWFDDDFALPSQCHITSFRVNGGFGLDPGLSSLSYVFKVAKRCGATEFGYVVDHWGDSASQLLLEWVQYNPHVRQLELGTDIVACLTRCEWLKWMTLLGHVPLRSLTLHVGRRYDEERAILLRDMLKQNRRIDKVSFVGFSWDVRMQSIYPVCSWNRFVNGVSALSCDDHQEALLHLTVQRSQMEVHRLAFVLSQRADMLCEWVQDLSNVRKRSLDVHMT